MEGEYWWETLPRQRCPRRHVVISWTGMEAIDLEKGK